MVKIENLGIVLEKTNLAFENQAVLNPSCLRIGDTTHMFYRAVKEQNFSSIGYCKIRNGKVVERLDRPLVEPEYHFERHGVEDPRVVELDGVFYLFYTAYDGKDARAAYATSTDLVHFKKQGLVCPSIKYREAIEMMKDLPLPEGYFWYERHYEQTISPDVLLWEKDAFIFPKKFNNKFFLLHRIMPGIQVVEFEKFSDLTENFWRGHLKEFDRHILMNPQFWFETRKIGAGCPPIETPEGWLLIYHAVETNPAGNIYRACAALLDLENPRKVLARLPEPLFSPEEPWEKFANIPSEDSGIVNNIVFPTGAVLEGDRLVIYYGAADMRIAAKALSLDELLAELKRHPAVAGPVPAAATQEAKVK